MKTSRRARPGAVKVSASGSPSNAKTVTPSASTADPLPNLALEKWRHPSLPLFSGSPPPEPRPRRGGASLARDCVVVFRLAAPRAQSVKLAADFTDWEKYALSLQRGSDGEWEVKVSLPPGEYGYRFLVDDQWQDDPQCPRREANPFGTTNAVAEVR